MTEEGTRTVSGLEMDVQYADVVNYAIAHNKAPLLQKLLIKNPTESAFNHVDVSISSAPEFLLPFQQHFDMIPAGRTIDAPIHQLVINAEFLSTLSERLSGFIEIRATSDGKELSAGTFPMDVLAFDEWSGARTAPEFIASFVTPNDALIPGISKRASEYMKSWTDSDAMDAYQSNDPNRVRQQAAAVYAALQEWKITYAVAAASFENDGQRIRMPDMIFSQRMGNCLDLSVLYVSCLEAIGLHPLLIVISGHAFAGFWLVEESFPESVQDDLSALTKRMAKGTSYICVVESTGLATDSGLTFERAELQAQQHLSDPSNFLYSIDIHRARIGGIRPVPTRTWINGQFVFQTPPMDGAPGVAPCALAPDTILSASGEPRKLNKYDIWERKLLDLGLRNSLLNFRQGKSGIPILCDDLDDVEDALANGDEFSVLPRPQDFSEPSTQPAILQNNALSQEIKNILREDFRLKRLRTSLPQVDLDRSMIGLYRKAKEALEENGANVLYLALGFLVWYETASSVVPRHAPIILLPVDIVRKSAKTGYVVRARDDEPRINTTLLEMLKKDFGIHISGLDPLPADEAGIDTRRILSILRQAVLPMPRWDISENTCIGIFSFSRFVMWNDIHSRRADLEKNQVVQSLISGRLTWKPTEIGKETGNELEEFDPREILLAGSADASQLSAIKAAGTGQTLVLHGPPGTGKSQTITNIISNALAHNKTVLFVAEKMAALSVVEERLDKMGLGAFCLELHSNKATKKTVLEQLRIASETVKVRTPENYLAEAEELRQERETLNQYVRSLYREWPFGVSLYEALSRYFQVEEADDAVHFNPQIFAPMQDGFLIKQQECVDQLLIASRAVFPPSGHALRGIQLQQYSFDLREKADTLLRTLEQRAVECDKAFVEAVTRLTLPSGEKDETFFRGVFAIDRLIKQEISIPEAYFAAGNVSETKEQDLILLAHCKREQELKTQLRENFADSVFLTDPVLLWQQWQTAQTKWFLPRVFGQGRIRKLLKEHLLPGKDLNGEKTSESLKTLVEMVNEKSAHSPMDERVRLLSGRAWKDEQTDFGLVAKTVEHASQLETTIRSSVRNRDLARTLQTRLARIISDGDWSALSSYATTYQQLDQTVQSTSQLLSIDFPQLAGGADDSYTQIIGEAAIRWRTNLSSLREWCQWMLSRDVAIEMGLLPLINSIEVGTLPLDAYPKAYQRGLYKACISYIMQKDAGMSQFSGLQFEEKIRRLRLRTEKHRDLARRETYARISAALPDLSGDFAQSSELGILKRAIRSNGRGQSIRGLFNQIPNVLTKLCPCLLMSPISVAQYLDPMTKPFDLIIFDEASQVPTSEAVGALARGANAIIVGDPKQLPPTSFFEADSTDEENTDIEDLESILDDCMALSFPELHLKWHYRSRHESLITFSNVNYYDNSLYTFPSPNNRVSRVHLVPVQGYYDRGGTRQNLEEAKAVIADITRRLRDPELRKKSIGVVTFSSVQQILIDDLLQVAYQQNPELETLAAESTEPIIIKNLENVQGDERDVILFSVGYGPDKTGRVSHNFGPLNRNGGWRRLNVAVSRARFEMTVYSTLMPDKIDTARTASEGIRGLRDFLLFAQRGVSGLAYQADEHASEGVDLNTVIAKKLASRGLSADANIGSSRYKIDVAIVHPDKPEEYILGLLCNGSSYKESRTASDREILQNQILSQLGWNLHSVWAVDWLENHDKECDKVLEVVRSLREAPAKVAGPGATTGPCASAGAGTSAGEGASSSAGEGEVSGAATTPSAEALVASQSNTNIDEPFAAVINTPTAQEALSSQSEILQGFIPLSEAGNPGDTGKHTNHISKRCYEHTVLPLEVASSDELCLHRSPEEIARRLNTVIQKEGPISQSLLFRRVLQSYGLSRVGPRLEQLFSTTIHRMQNKTTKQTGEIFYWPNNQVMDVMNYFRSMTAAGEKRNAEEIPVQEYAAAAVYVLERQFSMLESDLIREVAKEFGYTRTGTNVISSIQSGLALAQTYKMISIKDGKAEVLLNKN
jgi:DNA polymerase III delta prime subunit